MPDAGPLRKLFTIGPMSELNEPEPPHTFDRSPNFSRRETTVIDTIVVHCTAGSSTSGAVATLKDPAREASAHIVIPDDKRPNEPTRTVRLVEDRFKSFHVRRSLNFQGRNDINSRSFGMEIVNAATTTDSYSDFQVQEAARWTRFWISNNPIRFIVTHGLLDPTRRRDPCDTFPWDRYIDLVTQGLQNSDVTENPLKFVIKDGNNSIPVEADGDIQDGTTWAELRPILTALGHNIAFDASTFTVTITK